MIKFLKRLFGMESARDAHLRILKEAGVQPMIGINLETGKERILPVLEDSSKNGEHLSLREIQCIEHNECPDCGGEIRWGPCGGMSQNVKCFGGCGVKFNYTGAISERLEDRKFVSLAA